MVKILVSDAHKTDVFLLILCENRRGMTSSLAHPTFCTILTSLLVFWSFYYLLIENGLYSESFYINRSVLVCLLFFETGFHFVDHGGFKLAILLP
jgi:hypothetical protein